MQKLINHRQKAALPVRAFASQPNPFDKSVKASIEHNGKKHHFYKLPALGDSRI
jgi:hypothetical protein